MMHFDTASFLNLRKDFSRKPLQYLLIYYLSRKSQHRIFLVSYKKTALILVELDAEVETALLCDEK